MFVFKIVKGIIKAVLGLIITFVIAVALVSWFLNYANNTEDSSKNVSYMMEMYDRQHEYPEGTWTQCPVCGTHYAYEDGKYFCSRECEKDYWKMVKAYKEGEKAKNVVESYGKRLK